MRFRILTLVVMAHFVAVPSSVAQAQKRSAALSIRVTVVRSCSVSTSPATPSGTLLQCDSPNGATPRLSTSTLAAPTSSASAPVHSTPVAEGSRVAASHEGIPSVATTAESDSSVQEVNSTEIAERIRVLTVNF